MKKIPIWKNVVLIVSVLVVIIVATFAWFYTMPSAPAKDLLADVGKAGYIQISGDEGNNWSEDLNMEIGINKNFKEISGNGSEFFAPVYDVVENVNGGFSTQLVSFTQVDEGQYYYEQIMDFRADTVQEVYLKPESYVKSVDALGNSYIDGAIRVAFFEIDENGNETLTCIWAPNSTVEYSAETNSFNREGTVESYYYYQTSATPVDMSTPEASNSDVVKISTEETDETGCGYNPTYKFMWSNGQQLPENAPFVLTADVLGEDELFYKRLKVKVWLEGHDRECVSLLSGQKFTMKLQFTAQEVE